MNIRSIKKDARKTLKRHLFISILVCFVVTLLVSNGYKYNTSRISSDDKISSSITRVLLDTNNFNAVEKFVKNTSIYNKFEEVTQYRPTRGVLSVFFNQITGTGSIIIGILNVNNEFFFNNSLSSMAIFIIGLIIYLLLFVFVQNIIIVGKNRYFLEHNKYRDTPFDKILFIYRVRQTKNVALIMLRRIIYTLLWWLTIIGGVIKHYEYSMIPYILAENPKINSKDCFELSKRMTIGNKLKMFILDITFIPWHLLGFLTLGLTNIFYFNPYKESVYAKMYMVLRSKIYDENKRYFKDKNLNGESVDSEYPFDKYFIEEVNHKKWLNTDLDVNYSIKNLILLFFTFSMVGYIWEVSLGLFNEAKFINRGILFGPWLPVYGCGGVLVLLFLYKFKKKPLMLFTSSFILSGVVEYFTAWYLETFKHLKWWDYSGYFLNLQGRICLEGLLVFALASCICSYFLAPYLNNFYNKMKPKLKEAIIIILSLLFLVDVIYSHFIPNTGDGITVEIEKEHVNKK